MQKDLSNEKLDPHRTKINNVEYRFKMKTIHNKIKTLSKTQLGYPPSPTYR